MIRELEAKIKSDYYDYLFVGTDNFRYEWIDENIQFDEICKYVEWEVANSYIGIDAVEEPQ